jgi:hypothetical protein
VIANGLDAPAGIAVDESHVYFVERDGGRVARCPLSGCDGAPEVMVSDLDGPIAVGVDDTTLYWVTGWTEGQFGNPGGRAVSSCPIDDCSDASIESFDTAEANPWGIRVTDDAVYLAAWPTVLLCPKTGCFDQGEVVGTGSVVALDVDDQAIYLSYAGWREVGRCPIAGCESTGTFLTGIQPLGIAVDETHVYVADNDYFDIGGGAPSRIVRCELAGCDDDPEVFASDVMGVFGVAVQGDRLYYSDLDAGTVVSFEKQ